MLLTDKKDTEPTVEIHKRWELETYVFLRRPRWWSSPPSCWSSPQTAPCSGPAHACRGPGLLWSRTSAWSYGPLYRCWGRTLVTWGILVLELPNWEEEAGGLTPCWLGMNWWGRAASAAGPSLRTWEEGWRPWLLCRDDLRLRSRTETGLRGRTQTLLLETGTGQYCPLLDSNWFKVSFSTV